MVLVLKVGFKNSLFVRLLHFLNHCVNYAFEEIYRVAYRVTVWIFMDKVGNFVPHKLKIVVVFAFYLDRVSVFKIDHPNSFNLTKLF